MLRPLPLLLALGLWATSAAGAERLELARAQAAHARAQALDLRARQQQLQGELDVLGHRIESLKARARGKLLPGGELDASLKRSQELSGALTGLATALERAHADSDRANAALAAALSDELSGLESRWDAGGHDERARLMEHMRALRAERESLRGALPAAQVPALLPARGSDDPEELLEQADALRDAGDKVKKRLAALEARITEAREERELDRRMGEFSNEGAVFDEQDRRLRLDHDPHAREFGFRPTTSSSDVSSPTATGLPGAGESQHPAAPSPASLPPSASPGAQRPEDGDDLKSLEAQRAQLRQLAAELERKAAAVESKARGLR